MYEKFEALLKANGASAYKVAKATGISNSMLSSWKKGRSIPKLATLQLIADYFHVPVSYFYDDLDYALGVTEEQAQSLGIDTQAIKHQLSTQLLDEQTLAFAQEYQKLNEVQKAAIEAVINGFLQSNKR